jgi:integrase
MAGRPRSVPSYRRHKQSGQALITLTDGFGGRRDVLLGKYGSKESRVEYARLIAEWEATGRRLPAATDPGSDLTINELLAAFWRHAQGHYVRPDGTPTNELDEYRLTFRPVKQLYAHTPAAAFGPLALKAVRKTMIDADLSRGVVNQRCARIKHVFKWGVSEELIPESVYSALHTVAGLPKGRSAARETEPVKPVADKFVDAVLPHVLPPIRAMIELQRLTGMRPGEVCAMRACDIDTTGAVWFYRPEQHKTAWRGKSRTVALGPKAQAVVKPFLTLSTTARLFSPCRALADRAAALRASRKTKVQPSQESRRVKNPKRQPRDFYTVAAYGHAIYRACDKADRLARAGIEKAKAEAEGREPIAVPEVVPDAERIIPRWWPSRLRPAPDNWRTHPPAQRDAFRALLSEIGFAGAELVRELPDGSLELIDGHLRAEEMGDREVPVLVTDLTEDEARKLLATFDPVGALAQADAAKLDALLQQVTTSDGAVAKMPSDLAEAAGTKDVRKDGIMGGDSAECEYPLTPVPGEKYDYVLVFCDNESDFAHLQTILKVAPRADYKSTAVAAGRVVTFGEFKASIEEWAKSCH